MSKNSVIGFTSRDTIADPLTDLLKAGIEQLIYVCIDRLYQAPIEQWAG